MYKVYILQSLKDGRTYTGYTSDLEKRIHAHNSGKVNATKSRRPLVVMFFEEVASLSDAEKREFYWKSGGGRRRLKKIFSEGSRPV